MDIGCYSLFRPLSLLAPEPVKAAMQTEFLIECAIAK